MLTNSTVSPAKAKVPLEIPVPLKEIYSEFRKSFSVMTSPIVMEIKIP